MHKWIRVVLSFGAIAFLLLGCGGEDGAALPGGGSAANEPEQSDDRLPHSGAPSVDSPIDTAKWENDPCSVIPLDELVDAGLTNPITEPADVSTGPGCSWESLEDAAGLDGLFFKKPGSGLSHFYAKNQAGDFEVFEPIEVEGYPAVAAMPRQSDVDRGGCAVDVGVRDDLTYEVMVLAEPESEWHEDPCAAAEKVAGLAIKTMTEGS